MKCGLPDGMLYDAVLVGLDKVGDVALIKLLPKKAGDKFPFAKLGDSDKVQAGDWSLAMGNPFLLATDFTPTVTFGLVSGVHRYQYPAGTLLEYTDCIQIDTSINPGNSGGPLFNMDGELIGINGRGSFEKRGRVNSGVGYAISINQIKNFLGQLQGRPGHRPRHARRQRGERDGRRRRCRKIVVKAIIDDRDARRRGLDVGDQLCQLRRPADEQRSTSSRTSWACIPSGWRVPLVYRRDNEARTEILVRLMGVQRRQCSTTGRSRRPGRRPGPAGRPPDAAGPPSPAAKFYKAKAGFANYYFNKPARTRPPGWRSRSTATSARLTGDWTLKLGGKLLPDRAGDATGTFASIDEKGGDDGKSPTVQLTSTDLDYTLEPLNAVREGRRSFKDPPGSGGLLLALYQYRQLLVYGAKGFDARVHPRRHRAVLPAADRQGASPTTPRLRVDGEVLRTEHAGVGASGTSRRGRPDDRWTRASCSASR